MFLQQIVLILIFLAAVAYVGFMLYRSFQAKSGCASGCGKCGAIDFAKIEQKIKDKQV
jgi:FeoB-associated Cys-rich membrane protein